MDACDGFSTTKNPGGLLVVPYDYSTWPTTQERQQQKPCVTGEPDTWKLVSPVRGEGVEKGHSMYLVGVLLYHWAHEKREDGCHSPAEVMGWHKGTMYPASVLDRILFATWYTRHLNQQGYLRFHDWKLYGERGLANEEVAVWVYEGTLKIEYRAVTLSRYTVELQEDRRHLKGLVQPQLLDVPVQEQAVGADQAAIRHPWLHPVPQVSEESEEEE